MHGLTELRTEPQNFTACSRNYKLLKPTQQSSPILFIFQSMQFSNQATALMYWAKDWTQNPAVWKYCQLVNPTDSDRLRLILNPGHFALQMETNFPACVPDGSKCILSQFISISWTWQIIIPCTGAMLSKLVRLFTLGQSQYYRTKSMDSEILLFCTHLLFGFMTGTTMRKTSITVDMAMLMIQF